MRLAALVLLSLSAFAQQRPDKAAQIEAMKKLSFLTGKWQGEAVARMGPGDPVKLAQTEDVRYMLDGTILLIEGVGRNPQSGAKLFNALGIVSYDEASKSYRIRAYTEGRQIDAPFEVSEKGFKWSIASGGYRVDYAMLLNENGEWHETGDVTAGERTFRTVDMTLRRQ
jgi:hypothetical protein